jgi:hypothetical protein
MRTASPPASVVAFASPTASIVTLLLNATCSVRLTCTMPHTSVTIRRPRSRSCGRSRTAPIKIASSGWRMRGGDLYDLPPLVPADAKVLGTETRRMPNMSRVPDAFRRSAAFVTKVLQGSKPADLRSSTRRNSTWWSTSRPRRRSACVPVARRHRDRLKPLTSSAGTNLPIAALQHHGRY